MLDPTARGSVRPSTSSSRIQRQGSRRVQEHGRPPAGGDDAHLAGCAAAKQGKFVAFKNAFWEQGFAQTRKMSTTTSISAIAKDDRPRHGEAQGRHGRRGVQGSASQADMTELAEVPRQLDAELLHQRQARRWRAARRRASSSSSTSSSRSPRPRACRARVLRQGSDGEGREAVPRPRRTPKPPPVTAARVRGAAGAGSRRSSSRCRRSRSSRRPASGTRPSSSLIQIVKSRSSGSTAFVPSRSSL